MWLPVLGAILELALHPSGPRLGAFGRGKSSAARGRLTFRGCPGNCWTGDGHGGIALVGKVGDFFGFSWIGRSGHIGGDQVQVAAHGDVADRRLILGAPLGPRQAPGGIGVDPGNRPSRRVAWAGTSVIWRFTAGTSRIAHRRGKSARCSTELRGCAAFAAPAEVAVGAPVWVASVAAEVGASTMVTVVTVVAALNDQLTPR